MAATLVSKASVYNDVGVQVPLPLLRRCSQHNIGCIFYKLNLTFGLDLLPNDTRFYTDPNFTDGVYTMDYIKPNAITDSKDFAL